jgi:hypothetical protein
MKSVPFGAMTRLLASRRLPKPRVEALQLEPPSVDLKKPEPVSPAYTVRSLENPCETCKALTYKPGRPDWVQVFPPSVER